MKSSEWFSNNQVNALQLQQQEKASTLKAIKNVRKKKPLMLQ